MSTLELNKETIVNALHLSVCEVTFAKTNGEQRVMRCTLNPSMLPVVEVSDTKRTKKENSEVQAVYDVQAEGWRSFRWDLLQDFRSEVTA